MTLEPSPAEVESDEVASDGRSFADFYAQTHPEMVRLAYFMTSSREVAEDVAQDAYVKMQRPFATAAEPRAYLRRVVVNACVSHQRRRRVAERLPMPTWNKHSSELHADELFDVLRTLPARQRAAVVLRYWHDLSDADIADAIGCRPATVGSLLHRAIAQLRKVIEP
jgi:RNA polymerase sigma-70 factor (sigma-E family)